MDGYWSTDRRPARTEEERRASAALEAIGYAGGYEDAPTLTGVTVHQPDRAQAGYNLFTSGHAAEASLVDMQGEVLHTWQLDYDQIPDAPASNNRMLDGAWRRVALLPDGSLLAIYEGLLLIKIDRDSKLLWTFDVHPHHDLEVQPDGSIYVLTRESAFRESLSSEQPILEDFVSVLDAEGKELRRVSIVDAFLNSEFANQLRDGAEGGGDVLHTNTIEVLDGRLHDRVPAFDAGSVLLSFRTMSALAVLDMDAQRITWFAEGPWVTQHQPTVLDNGNLLLFDNLGHAGSSQVIEFDPLTLEFQWTYRGDPAESFLSVYCGSNQRLANGNTLISDTCNGRAIEVSRDGEIAWEFINPHRAGDDDQLIAAIFEMLRVPADSLDWLKLD
jgi:Arylsulfotransferase (ASST)